MGETLPTEPQAARPAGSGKVAAIVGIVLGFIAYIVPGIFSLRSYRRWKRGEIRRPIFAWTTAAIVGPLLVLSAVAFFLLYTLPLVVDDFSDPTSGCPTERPVAHLVYGLAFGLLALPLLRRSARTTR